MSHQLIVLNAGYCGGCEACGNKEEIIGCSCGEWSDYPVDPDAQFAAHLEEVDDEPATETEWLGHKGDDPWAAALE